MTKLALLMGLAYRGTSKELPGCIPDILATRKKLLTYGYTEQDIGVMTDDSPNPPTRSNMMRALLRLCDISYEDPEVTEIWISYSGHGSYVRDYSGDEDDGRDECLVPLDYETAGMISDDELNSVLALIRQNVRVIWICDACHSETMLDLKYRYIQGVKHAIENQTSKIRCNCLMISGCKDTQTSADTYGLIDPNEYSGAMTAALLFVLDKFEDTITCYRLLKEMRRYLRARKFRQIPQLTCTNKLTEASLFVCHTPRPFIRN